MTHGFTSFSRPSARSVTVVQNHILRTLRRCLLSHSFGRLVPVLVSPVASPLGRTICPTRVRCRRQHLGLATDVVFRGRLTLATGNRSGVFVITPGVHLRGTRVGSSRGRLLRFSRFSFRVHSNSVRRIVTLVRNLVGRIFDRIGRRYTTRLTRLGHRLPRFADTFPVCDSSRLHTRRNSSFRGVVSTDTRAPFFIAGCHHRFCSQRAPNGHNTCGGCSLVCPSNCNRTLSNTRHRFRCRRVLCHVGRLSVSLRPFTGCLRITQHNLLRPDTNNNLKVRHLLGFVYNGQHVHSITLFSHAINADFLF